MSAALDATIGDAVDQFALDRDKSREMFIGMLGHDLRDPLNTIVFSAQNLLDEEHLDARPLIGTAVEDIAHAHPERELTWLAATAAGDFHVEWDGDRIAQAISNLVGNAIAHGSDPIVVEPIDRGETIAIEVRNRGAIVPSVLPGCSSRFRNRQRTAVCPRQSGVTTRGRTRAASGGAVTMGLGLYIVREISVAHGGQVMAESEEGTTTFA